MENKQIVPVLEIYGGANVSSFDMTPEQFSAAAQNVMRRAKEKAWSKGLPVYYKHGEHLIAEFSGERKETVIE